MTVQERVFTAEDLLRLPRGGKRYALLAGQIIEMTPTGEMHGLITAEITYRLTAFVRQHDLGRVYGAETGFKLSENPDTVYGIDAAFIAKARVKPVREGYIEGAPDLAVEVVSPGNTSIEMHEKIHAYFVAGAQLVWVIYPKARTIYVYHTEDDIKVRHETDSLDGGAVLPGLSLSIADLFAVLKD
jgi:Uma2 family endonuclease